MSRLRVLDAPAEREETGNNKLRYFIYIFRARARTHAHPPYYYSLYYSLAFERAKIRSSTHARRRAHFPISGNNRDTIIGPTEMVIMIIEQSENIRSRRTERRIRVTHYSTSGRNSSARAHGNISHFGVSIFDIARHVRQSPRYLCPIIHDIVGYGAEQPVRLTSASTCDSPRAKIPPLFRFSDLDHQPAQATRSNCGKRAAADELRARERERKKREGFRPCFVQRFRLTAEATRSDARKTSERTTNRARAFRGASAERHNFSQSRRAAAAAAAAAAVAAPRRVHQKFRITAGICVFTSARP